MAAPFETPPDRPTDSIDPKDGGYKSRKFAFSLGTSLLIFLGGIIAGKWPAFAPQYPAMIGGLLGVLTIFVSGNLGHKWIFSNSKTSLGGSEDESKE